MLQDEIRKETKMILQEMEDFLSNSDERDRVFECPECDCEFEDGVFVKISDLPGANKLLHRVKEFKRRIEMQEQYYE